MVVENRHVKVGDYVRLINSKRKLNKLAYGYVYKVLSIDANKGYVDDSVYITELKSTNGIVKLKMQESYFEILPPMVSVKKKFQVGDKVICVKNTLEVQEGWIGFITPEKSDFGFVAENEDGQGYAFTEDELELLNVSRNSIARPILTERKVGKVQMDLFDSGFPNAITEVAKVMTWAAENKGYKPHDWKGLPNAETEFSAAASRHRVKGFIQKAEGVAAIDRTDEESNIVHLAHTAFNILAELELVLTGKIK